jgi:tRNA (guanine-N7-)-methyltransferase
MTTHPAPHFFGRRKGKPLRQRQSLLVDSVLPNLRISPADVGLFAEASASPFKELWLEIGFGGGEHLACDAQLHPSVCFIGCEPFLNGVAKLVAAIEEKKIQNIRIYDGDALEILRALPEARLGRITILYPDPWPKFRQRKRRFISHESIVLMARALSCGGEVHFATDIDDYSAWTLARFLASDAFEWRAGESSDWKRPWAAWPGTRYEAKAIREGRTPAYLTFVRKSFTAEQR